MSSMFGNKVCGSCFTGKYDNELIDPKKGYIGSLPSGQKNTYAKKTNVTAKNLQLSALRGPRHLLQCHHAPRWPAILSI